MARRLLIISIPLLVVLLGLSSQTPTLNAANYATTTVDGLIDILTRTAPPNLVVVNGDIVSLTEDLGPGVIVTDLNSMNGKAGVNFQLTITKSGQGLWRLGGVVDDPTTGNPVYGSTNVLTTGNVANNFNVNGGILELMRGTTIQTTGGIGSGFSVSAGASLNARGGNTITPAGGLQLSSGSTIGIDLMDPNNTIGGTPVLTINGNVTKGDVGDVVNLSLLGFKDTQTTAIAAANVLQYNYTVTMDGATPPAANPPPIWVGTDGVGGNVNLTVRGEDWATVKANSGGRLQGTVMQDPTPYAAAAGAATTTIYIKNLISNLTTVTWTGAANDSKWNATTQNWTLPSGAATTFLHGDSVVFNSGVANTNIEVQAGGVQIGSPLQNVPPETKFGMFVNGGIYSFTNAAGSNIGIDGPGAVYIDGNQTAVTFNSANSYWGGTVLSNVAELTIKNIGSLGSGLVDMQSMSKLIIDLENNGSGTITNNIIGTEGTQLIKEGTGTVTLAGNTNSSGDTIVKAGTLQNGSPSGNGIGTGVLTVYKNATYDAADRDTRIAGLSDGPIDPPNPDPNGGIVNMGKGNLSITIDYEREYSFSGSIISTAELYKYGNGTQVFAGDSPDFTGPDAATNIAGGKILVKRTLATSQLITPLGTGPVTIGENCVLQFDLNGGQDVVATFNNKIYGTGTLLKQNATTPDVADPNSAVLFLTSTVTDQTLLGFTGLTDIREGALRVGSIHATGKTYEIRLAQPAELQFQLTDSSKSEPFDRIVTGAGGVKVIMGSTVYVRGTNDDDPKRADVPIASNYTGATTVQANAHLHLLNSEATGLTSEVNLETPTSTLYLDFDQDQVYDRYITGFGNLVKDGLGVATLAYSSPTIDNDYQGTTTVNSGTLRLLYAGATGPVDVPPLQSVTVNGTGILELAFNGKYYKGITGTGGIAKSGTGLTILQGYSSYTGGTHIYGTKNADGTFTPAGTLSFTDTTSQVGNLGTGGVFFERGGGTLQNTKENIPFTQNIVIDAGSTATFDNQAEMTLTGPITHRDVSVTDPYYNPNDTQSHFVKKGAFDLTINGPASWTGTTTVEEGRLINNIPNGTALTVKSLGTYVTGSSERIVSMLLGEGNVITSTNYNFVINNAAQDTFAGSIQGEGNLVKQGAGLLVLSGVNSYSGSTTILSGTLRGNIASQTALRVEGLYEAGNQGRVIRSLTGGGVVDMQFQGLTINTMDRSATDPAAVFSGNIQNGQSLTKDGAGTQAFTGASYSFYDTVTIQGGKLQLGTDSMSYMQFTVGQNLTIASNGTLGIGRLTHVNVGKKLTIDGTLDIVYGNNIVNAESVTLGNGSTINISGIADTTETRTIIQSQTDIIGQFTNVHIAGDPSTNVDYLIFGVSYDDPKAVKIGQSLRWYSGSDAHGTFTLSNPEGVYDVGVPLVDITDASKRQKDWDGKTLTKQGPGTLILSAVNTYTGPTQVYGGTLVLANAEATGGSSKVVLGDAGALALDFTGTMKTPITGTGTGVYKTGDSIAVLSGVSSYTAPTEVQQGSLFIDGSIASQVWVDAGAGFGGNGTVYNTVNFRDGSFFDWRFGKTEAESDMLKTGGVHIGNDVFVRPTTSLLAQDTLTNFDGWRILRYDGTLNREFAGVDNNSNPFYDFELDYSEPGFVRISGFLRNEPRPLSDIVATSLSMAQTRMYRSVYQQMLREWCSDCPQHPCDNRNVRTNGQEPRTYRSAWVNFVGRGDQYASNYFQDDYKFQAYGVQAGLSLISNCRQSFGILYGREEGKLNNCSDEVRSEDNYLGLYYGHAFSQDYDFRGYIGGGWQQFRLDRQSNGHHYRTNYKGNTFNIDVEFGRRFITEGYCILRPFIGFDLAVSRIGSSMESLVNGPYSNEYRGYERSSMTQFLSRAGVELTKSWRRFDFNTGAQLAWNWADSVPETKIIYPATGGAVYSRGADLGQFDLILNVGVNWYVGPGRNTMFYLNYVGDVYLDRQGDTGSNTGTVGFLWRF